MHRRMFKKPLKLATTPFQVTDCPICKEKVPFSFYNTWKEKLIYCPTDGIQRSKQK